MTLFTDSSKHGFAVCQYLDLADVVVCLTTVLVIDGIPDLTLLTCHNCTIRLVWYIGDAIDLDITASEVVIVTSFQFRM